jgi:DNA-binding transcriptional LysR family regulator
MELFQVRYFLTLSRTLNFTRAAEECHVSQPALSRAILQLEGELGGDLFRRERNLSHLTELGRAVLPALQQCYEASVNAKALAQAFLKQDHTPLHLAMSRSIDMELMSPLLGEITHAFPRIEIKVYRGAPHEIAEKLKGGEAEVAVAGPLGDDWERFDSRKLYRQQFGLLIAREHPLAQRNAIAPQELLAERLLCRPHCPMTDSLVAKLRSLGGSDVTRHEVPLIDDLAGLVRANFGIGVWPMERRMAGDFSLNQVEGVDLSRWIHVHSVAGRRHSVATATLIGLLRARDWTPPPPIMPVQSEAVH